MRHLLVSVLLLVLVLPGRAQGPDQEAIKNLRLGNYPEAERQLRLALQANPTDRTLQRLMANCQLGLGRTGAALAMAEDLASSSRDAQETLALEMLAVTAAYLDSRPRRVDFHLARLDAILPRSSGPYADYGRFLSQSFRFDLDLNRNPDLPVEEIVRRHRQAWSLLEGLQSSPEFTSELFWLSDVYDHAWLAVILQTRRENARQVIAQAGVLDDVQLVSRLSERFPDQPAPGLAAVGMTVSVANVTLNFGDLSKSQQLADQLESVLVPVYREYALTGYLSGLMANLASLRFWQLYQQAGGRPDPARMEALGQEATGYARRSGNLETIMNIAIGQADYYLAARPAGWSARAQKALQDAFAEPGFLSVRRNQIWGYYFLGQLFTGDEAIAAYQKAVTALEGYIADMGGGAGAVKQIRTEFAPLYEKLAQEQLKKGENPGAFETLGRWDQVQSSQTFSLDDLKGRVSAADQKLVVRAQEARDEIATRESQVAALKTSNASSQDIERASKLLADTRQSYAGCMEELARKDSAFRELDIKPVNFSKVQRCIPADTLVIQYFSSEEKLYLMEASREKLVVREVPLKRAELDEAVREVRAQIIQFGGSPGSFTWSSEAAAPLHERLSRLRKVLIEPAAPEMADKKVLALIPYGSLMYLPFQCLASGPPEQPKFLIEEKQLVVLCKATDLDQVYGPPSSKAGSLVAFGNPDRSLPGANEEVTALKAVFPGAQVYLESQATNEKMSSVQAPGVAYLHLATHGILNSKDTRASYLVMAQGQKLSVPDIAGYRLDNPESGDDLNLVTLSACQTALAERNPTGSDLRTLADAFSLAGCRSMVASLWKVSDNSTRDLMVEFYRELKAGKPKSQAIQEAEVRILKRPEYQHPYFWAPFILIGDWR